MKTVKIIGGGLAGVEAAYQLLKRGIDVAMYEMRPHISTEAHKTGGLAELVCSNSLKSMEISTSQGLLKAEMEILDSLVLKCAKISAVSAGGALAIDREVFSQNIEAELRKFANFKLIRQECVTIDDFTIVASGPLTSPNLVKSLYDVIDTEYLNFYDAVAPIIKLESVDMENAFYQSRYDKGGADYLNCPLTKEEYYQFIDALVNANVVMLKEFEKKDIFNACMPVEVMAKKGIDSLRFGPLKPVGIRDPKTDKRPFAVVQLRKEDNFDKLVNLVGFQTNLTFLEQKKVFGMIPALKNAEFVRYGVLHRNTYIDSPKLLNKDFSLRKNPTVFIAGQLSGTEGYMESAMGGLLSGINMANRIFENESFVPNELTAMGSLIKYITEAVGHFAPMHVSYSLMPELNQKIRDKSERKKAYSTRALAEAVKYREKVITLTTNA